jgi:rubrerythrin
MAARRSADAAIRQLLGDLAAEERRHEARAEELEAEYVTPEVETQEQEVERRLFLLQIVQPGLAGLMDGSVSTLAPLFAAAFATQHSWPTFLVGLAAAVGAGISMGFAEALSDNGSLTGRGSPWLRGLICGAMTALGGLGHTLPFLVPSFTAAMSIAAVVVIAELAAIAWIRNRYMDTPLFSAAVQIVGGGFLVFATGVVIGSG